MSIDQDSHFMRRALEQAARATRSTLPNPSVGAVLAHDNKVYSEGYHHFFGGPHAEVNAIRAVSDVSALPKSTLYVTLEPCSHTGKTPPCVDLIIASKIPRVVVGCRDPFPAVSGRGIAALRAAGIKVCEDVLHDHCVVANRRFILAHRMKRPYIILKWLKQRMGLSPQIAVLAQALVRTYRISSFIIGADKRWPSPLEAQPRASTTHG